MDGDNRLHLSLVLQPPCMVLAQLTPPTTTLACSPVRQRRNCPCPCISSYLEVSHVNFKAYSQWETCLGLRRLSTWNELFTITHILSLPVTWLESLGKHTGLLMFYSPHGIWSHISYNSHCKGELQKNVLCQRYSLHQWRMGVCLIKYAQCSIQRVNMQHQVDLFAGGMNNHNTMQHAYYITSAGKNVVLTPVAW